MTASCNLWVSPVPVGDSEWKDTEHSYALHLCDLLLSSLTMIAVAQAVHATMNPTASLAQSIKEAEDLDAADPLRHYFASSDSSGWRAPNQATDDELLPKQLPTVSRQTTQISFGRETSNGGVPISINLVVDASPGCGGIAWPAGQVNTSSLRRHHALFMFSLVGWYLGPGAIFDRPWANICKGQAGIGAR